MSDIADMMLDGILCEGCGEYVGDSVGYPRRCRGCRAPEPPVRKEPKGKRVKPGWQHTGREGKVR